MDQSDQSPSTIGSSNKPATLRIPALMMIVPLMLLFGPILLAVLFIIFVLIFGVFSDTATVSASHISPVHQGPSESVLWNGLFLTLVSLSLLFGAFLWLFLRKRNISLMKEFSGKSLFRESSK